MHGDLGYFEESRLEKSYDFSLLKRMLPFLRPFRRLLVWSVVLVLLITALDLAIPYVTKVAIDRFIVPQERRQTAAAADPAEDRRVLHVSIREPQVRSVVEKYPHLFARNGDTATIGYRDLDRLERSDLANLRKDDLTGLAVLSAAFLMLIALNFILNFAQKMTMEYAGQWIMHDLRMKLFAHIQHSDIEFFTRNPVGRLVTRATNDVQNMHELFTSVITFVFKDLFLLIGISLVLVIMNWKLTLVVFSLLPVMVYASIVFAERSREVFRELRIKIAEINTRFAETVSGMRIVQLFQQERNNYRSFKGLNHENYLAGMRQIHVLAIFLPVIEILSVIATALIIYFGGGSVLRETLTLGELVAFISYIRMFFRPIRDLAEKYNILQNAMSSAERLFLILDTPRASRAQPLQARQGRSLERIREIRLENIHFSYVRGERVLKGIDLDLRRGETLAVVGPTGAGKTSLISLIPRFYDPTEGRVLINGRDIREMDPALYRSQMALVTQDPFLFSGTIRANVFQDPDRYTPRQMEAVLTAANCRDMIENLTDGLDTMLSEGGASISSGERQLLSIARALARDPQLILLDEATSYIDSETEKRIQQALRNLLTNRTAMIVAHRLSTVRSADRIIVLNRGRIVESGSHAELMARNGFYYHLQQLQT